MNVKAIIHEVFIELTSSGSRPGTREPSDKFLPVRRRYLDSFLDAYNGQKSHTVGEDRKAGDPRGACFQALLSEIATKKTP